MRIITLFLVSIIFLSGCTGKNGWVDLTKPVSIDARAPEGPYPYRQGWTDGCESGLSAVNDQVQLFLKTYKFTMNNKLKKNPLYFKAWNYGYNHCAFSYKSMMRYEYL